MADVSGGDITQLLRAWEAGDGEAIDRLVPLVYPELKRLAHRQLARRRAPAAAASRRSEPGRGTRRGGAGSA